MFFGIIRVFTMDEQGRDHIGKCLLIRFGKRQLEIVLSTRQ